MANTVYISPGVFTREKDQSFLQRGLSAIGAVFIGNTKKGPAFTPTKISNFSEFRQIFGNLDPEYYMPYAVQNYIKNSGVATIIRVLGLGGYQHDYIPIILSGSNLTSQNIGAILRPTISGVAASVTGVILWTSGMTTAANFTNFRMGFTGSGPAYSSFNSLSLKSTDSGYVGNIFGFSPLGEQWVYVDDCYTYLTDRISSASNWIMATGNAELLTQSADGNFGDYEYDYQEAETPFICSQPYGNQTTGSYNLFKFYTLTHGTDANTEIKVCLQDMRTAPVSGPDNYGIFGVAVRDYNDDDRKPSVLESFGNLNLDPTSKNFIAKRIGDRYYTTDSSGKITVVGNYDSRSKYIRVEMADLTNVPEDALPWGFRGYSKIGTQIVQIPYVLKQMYQGEYTPKAYHGIAYESGGFFDRFKPLPAISVYQTDTEFGLSLCTGNDGVFSGTISYYSSSVPTSMKKFILGFYKGFDGENILLQQGFDSGEKYDMSSATSSGTLAFRRAVDTIRNPDEYDFNLLFVPGVSKTPVINYALEMVEDRADAFYVMDLADSGSSVTDAIDAASAFDSNYAGVFYPWVKITDMDNEIDVMVPPTVVMAGVMSYNDKVAYPWYAPAGLNRGLMTTVKEAEMRLDIDDRNDLYEGRVNPLRTFPSEGVVVWGQKTLQVRPSALDRINVRRLIIYARKLISSAANYLVFEQNNAKTWDRFTSIVNPILRDIQMNQGLYAYKVVMDSSTNTPDLIDQNIMYGQIYLQPTRSAEIILLDFNVTRTGVSFEE